MSEMSIEMNHNCPGCDRHCELSAPGCPRGEAYARGEHPGEAARETEYRAWHERHDHHGGHGKHHRHGGHEWPGEHGPDRPDGWDCHEGRGGRGAHGKPPFAVSTEAYNAMDTDGKLGILLHELHHMSRFGMESRGGQGRILRLLANEGDMTQRLLTEKLGIQPGSVSEVIGKLERAGYVTRSENAEDRRTADIHLTQAGRERAEAREQEKPELFSALSEEEKSQLLTLLERLRGDWRDRFPRERHGHHEAPMHRMRHEP